ncbi:hypothetical protein AB0C29_46320, partial [Actinoplanes sp. NPDC048791]|uniref:hypothetical protein n=1 Tax=Actinoplanes sp. NPDC048791 TaxID=3154623 RepID=UPI0033F430DB
TEVGDVDGPPPDGGCGEVTESTSTRTHSRRDRWRALNMGDKAGVISAVIAAITALAAGGNWAWQHFSGPDDKAVSSAAATTPPAPTAGPDTSPPAGTASPSPGAGAGTPLDTLDRIGGAVVALPDGVTAADFSRPVAVECPSNDTGDQTRTLTYELDRRFHTFTATVSGWSETRKADPVEVRVYTKTRQKDDTFRTLEAGMQGGVVNEPGRALSAKVTGADQLLVEVRCQRPDGIVILDAATLGG